MTHKAGVVGTGGIAGMGILGMHDEEVIGKEKIDASHAGGYASTDGIDLVAVADIDEQNLETFGQAWDIPQERQYVGHDAMLAAEDLDVISVCTPSYLHHEHVLDAAQSAADPDVIWCEKPIASRVSAAEKMVEVCDETGTELVVNHSFRFTDKLQRLHDLIHKQDLLGEVKSVSTQYRMELMRNSTHVLDTLVYLLDARAEQVSGYINGENEAVDSLDAATEVTDSGGGGHLVMDEGTFITVDCTIPRDISSMMLNFIGTEGKLYLNNDDGEWRYWAFEDGEHVERPLPGIDGAWTWEDDYKRSFANAAHHVQDLLNGETENYSPGAEAARSLEIIVAFYLSDYTGSTIEVPLEPPLCEIPITSW
ncbi:Gfo/Idh/MocA family protein [Halococcus agarilyticus]|uniref:Gfo/Idh/MocA family protein n=1 Tax=Halococcus agarilyticus TaxID=1232219 RepID=UPI000677D723|nr:Gfo/Idh/MocA family oxidoreductase [Halococcus agarilyticus]